MKRWVIVLAAVAGLVALWLRGTVEAPVMLIFGWVLFLYRVLPHMTVDGPSLVIGAAAVVVFGAGLHLAARRWRGERVWKARWSFAVVVMVCVLFAGSVACVGIVHQVGWLAASDVPMKGEALMSQPFSQNNLRQIGLSIVNHGSITKDALPPGGTFTAEGEMLHG
jgi:hypothetical protein